MREIPRSPSEYYIRFLVSREKDLEQINANEIGQVLESLGLDSLSPSYIRSVATQMKGRPDPFDPENIRDKPSRDYLKAHKIFDMWHPTPAVREAQLILVDPYLREKLEPMLLSSLRPSDIARRLRKYTSIALTGAGVEAFGHYFWNRRLLTQQEWMELLRQRTYRNPYVQGLLTPPDVAPQHLPWVLGMSGPAGSFNTAEAAARIGQIAYKHALELEHMPATLDTTMSLKNCMNTLEKADVIMRRSDVALRDVLRQFQKFRMKLDEAKIVEVQQLTEGNFSKSGEGTDIDDEDDF
jgi:hypothetical protein